MKATRLFNPANNNWQFYMTAEDEAAFHDRFMTLKTISKALGDHSRTVEKRLNSVGIASFSANGQEFAGIFLRLEVERAFGRNLR